MKNLIIPFNRACLKGLTQLASDCEMWCWSGKLKSFCIFSDFQVRIFAKYFLYFIYTNNEQLTFFKNRRLLSRFYSLDFSFQREFYCGGIVTCLILPAVICLSKRLLSHACLSIKHLYCETKNGSLNHLSFVWLYLLLHGYLW